MNHNPIQVNDINNIRLEKLKLLKENKFDFYPENLFISNTSKTILNVKEENFTSEYSLSGRLKSKREHGKSIFLTLEDSEGTFQAYIKADDKNESIFNFIITYLDYGDYIYIKGNLFYTKTEELTIRLQDIKLFAKCLHNLPDSWHGFDDLETKYRQRYLDLMINKDAKDRFKKRSLIIKTIREYLDYNNFLEVETPMLHSIPGGAAAKPFNTHHNALDMELFLRVSPELYLKRLIVGGLERVYEINRNFRNEGLSTKHNPEFTMIEFYMAHHDYIFIMNFLEELIKKTLITSTNKLIVTYGEHIIDFSKPFDRLSAKNAILKYSEIKESDLSEDNINKLLIEHNIKNKTDVSYNEKIFSIFEEVAEKKLIQPTYIIDFPIELSPLSKRDSTKSSIAARFELFIAGMELANGFNELNDPFDQAERFKAQVELRKTGNDEAMYFDKDYIISLEYGLPPTVGVGIGIDRLVMLVTNTTTIKDVIFFPLLRKKD